ncbi:MAG: Fe-S cluster assembly protein SufB, partial [Halobacteriovoraceae bacterium]|nr:Fe-S cluster assembly protein SufB [Halobacteriovoraceae bacterium]
MSTEDVFKDDYKYGFYTDIETEEFPKGLNEDIVRLLSKKKNEPEWLLDYRLKAFRHWKTLPLPNWAKLEIPEIDFEDLYYYSAPKKKEASPESLDEVDPELLATFEKLGIPLAEQKRLTGVAVDVVFDSVSITTTWKEDLEKVGVVFCSISEAVRDYPDLVKKYLGTV